MILVLVAVGAIIFIILRRKRRSAISQIPLREMEETSSISRSIPILSNITIGKVLGEGNFGKVYMGLWNETPVALKVVGQVNDRRDFQNETAVLWYHVNHRH